MQSTAPGRNIRRISAPTKAPSAAKTPAKISVAIRRMLPGTSRIPPIRSRRADRRPTKAVHVRRMAHAKRAAAPAVSAGRRVADAMKPQTMPTAGTAIQPSATVARAKAVPKRVSRRRLRIALSGRGDCETRDDGIRGEVIGCRGKRNRFQRTGGPLRNAVVVENTGGVSGLSSGIDCPGAHFGR